MNTEKYDLEFTRAILVPPEEVYYAFTKVTAWQQWCCDLAQVDQFCPLQPSAGRYLTLPYTLDLVS